MDDDQKNRRQACRQMDNQTETGWGPGPLTGVPAPGHLSPPAAEGRHYEGLPIWATRNHRIQKPPYKQTAILEVPRAKAGHCVWSLHTAPLGGGAQGGRLSHPSCLTHPSPPHAIELSSPPSSEHAGHLLCVFILCCSTSPTRALCEFLASYQCLWIQRSKGPSQG